MKDPPPTISGEQVRQLLDVPSSIHLARTAYAAFAEGRIISPERAWLNTGHVSLYCMPAHAKQGKTIAVKIARVQSDTNRPSKSPLTLATIYLFDSKTGENIAVIEAEDLTAIRTAASTAVATDILASKRAKTLGIIGAGRQAEAHVPAILEVRQIEQVNIQSRTRSSAEELTRRLQERYLEVQFEVHDVPERVVESSDVLVLATNSSKPVFDGSMVSGGTHVNAIGAALPDHREVDTRLVQRSLVIVDSMNQAFSSYGDILIPLSEGAINRDHVKTEIGRLVAGLDRIERSSTDVTLFKSGGVAALDAVFADHLASRVLQS